MMRSKELLEYYLEKGIDAVNHIIYSNETRIAIVDYLMNKGNCYSTNQEIYKDCNVCKISHASFLKHINVLKYHNLIQTRKVTTKISRELIINATNLLTEIHTKEKPGVDV